MNLSSFFFLPLPPMTSKRYTDFSDFLRAQFPGKVQKISINAGFTCPNRDGAKGFGGCTYCNNQTFSPEYCRTDKSVSEQLEEGVRFFARKYPSMQYLAYFQAYTSTYGELEDLKRKYEEALACPYARRVAGILRRAGSPLLHPYRIRRGEHARPDAGAHQPGALRGGNGRCHPSDSGGGDSGGGAPHTRTARRVAERDDAPCRRAVVAAAHHAQATPVAAYPGDADGAGISGATSGFPPLYGR